MSIFGSYDVFQVHGTILQLLKNSAIIEKIKNYFLWLLNNRTTDKIFFLCWQNSSTVNIVPCTRNTTNAVLERIVLVVLVYKKMKPIILFSHCFLPNLFQNALINFLTLKRAHYIKNRFNLTKFYQKREKLTLIEKDKVAENDINAAQILNTSFANICK